MLRLSLLLALLGAPALSCTQDAAAARDVISATNAYRADYGRGAVKANRNLTKAAFAHACDLYRSGTFSHSGTNGSRVGDRVTQAGYRWRYVGENIATGQKSATEVVTAWRGSPGHNRTLLNQKGRHIGVAAIRKGRGLIWVMVVADKL
ncbi:MAG: CAP domain-containing protein [Pseudomonadota bacterium]